MHIAALVEAGNFRFLTSTREVMDGFQKVSGHFASVIGLQGFIKIDMCY